MIYNVTNVVTMWNIMININYGIRNDNIGYYKILLRY